jgi:hypothetical protein
MLLVLHQQDPLEDHLEALAQAEVILEDQVEEEPLVTLRE